MPDPDKQQAAFDKFCQENGLTEAVLITADEVRGVDVFTVGMCIHDAEDLMATILDMSDDDAEIEAAAHGVN